MAVVADTLPWTEKHRPSTLDDVVGNPAVVKELREWASAWEAKAGTGQPKEPGLVLAGPPGIGKTSAALALARERGWAVVEMNASDQRNEAVVTRIAGGGAAQDSFTGDGRFLRAKDGDLKLIILDEADNLSGNSDRGGMKAIVAAVSGARQPMIITANDQYNLFRKAPALRRLCRIPKLRKPQAGTIAKVLAKIAALEGVPVDRGALDILATRSGGDVRAAIADLEALASSGLPVTEAMVEESGYRDARLQAFDAVRVILTARSAAEAREAAWKLQESPDFLLLWLEENVPIAYRAPSEWARAFDHISRADMFLGRARRRQAFRLWAYATDIMTMGVAMAKAPSTRGFGRYQFPSWLRKMSTSRAARQKRDALGAKVGPHFHTGVRRARRDVFPLLAFLLANNEDLGRTLVRKLELDAGDIALLTGMKETSKAVKQLLPPPEPKPTRTKTPKATGKGKAKPKPKAADPATDDTPAVQDPASEGDAGEQAKDQRSLMEF